jgi:hypothetical protein
VALEVAGLEQEEVVLGVMVQQALQMGVMVLKEEEAVVQQISFLQKLTQEEVYLPH